MPPHETKNVDNEAEEEPFGLGCALELFVEVDEVFKMIENIKHIYMDQSQSEKAYEHFQFIIGQYKEQPHLLDSHLDKILETFVTIIRHKDSTMELKHHVFNYMFVVVNVRGYKVIVRRLPHEVSDFEPVLTLLESQDPTDTKTWATRYVLLLWLSIIVMIPFHLARFDGNVEIDSVKKTLMGRVLDVIKTYVVVSDKCRDAAVYLSSRFIIRNDVKEQHLDSYFQWAMSLSLSPSSQVSIKQGTLSSVAMILKYGKREDLLPYTSILLQWVVNDEIKQNSGAAVQKLIYKNVQRIGLTFLKPRLATWRYERGNRSLATNLSGGDVSSSAAPAVAPAEDPDDDIDVPDEIEEVIDQLIQGLRNLDSVVRWSAAKGIGRVTGRLPQDLADEVVGSVLELFSPREGDGAWHGGCLALAELGRRGLLLPKRLPAVVPVVLKALVYDEPRGYSSVGSHIRDAACYVCWSFARAYETEILKPFVGKIAATLLIVTCFDREINCRRAASAAFQENVGRQGTFPHGIDILTVADFFAVSVRNNTYLHISVYISQFEEYTLAMIEHLLNRKVDHWDGVIRELTAKSLHNLTPKAAEYMVQTGLLDLFKKAHSIDLNTRHGAVLAIGEILHSLSKIALESNTTLEQTVGSAILEQTKNLIPDYREKFYFRGMGGELMRQACCDFIEKCSLAHIKFHNHQIAEDWLNLLNECVAYNVPNIQTAAITALPVLLSEYFSKSESITKQNELVDKYIHELLSTSLQETRMGHALALGSLPKFMLQLNLGRIVAALIDASKITADTHKWAESRRDAIKALTSLTVTMSDEIGKDLDEAKIMQIYEVFMEGLKDYTQDKRGDVGAWAREASMVGLQTVTSILATQETHILKPELVCKITAGIAKQAVERIDRTRALAGKIFYSFIYSDNPIPNIPNYDELKQTFSQEECIELNWNSAVHTFPKFVELLQFPAYTYSVMLGMISSVGGLTETLVRYSSASLFDYLPRELKNKGLQELQRLCDVVLEIFKDYQKVDRVTVSMFRFLDKLFSSGCILDILEDTGNDWTKKILKLILSEISGCKDVHKLTDCINVLAQFVQVKNESCHSALVQLSILLCHRQPYIRRTTSTVLYESLLLYGDGATFNTENIDEVMQILSNTNWEEPVEVLKPLRNQMCTLMSIRVPVAKAKP